MALARTRPTQIHVYTMPHRANLACEWKSLMSCTSHLCEGAATQHASERLVSHSQVTCD